MGVLCCEQPEHAGEQEPRYLSCASLRSLVHTAGLRWQPSMRTCGLSPADRVLLVAAYRRTNLTLRQIAPLFGVSKSAADHIIGDLGPKLALRPRKWFAMGTVLIVRTLPRPGHRRSEQELLVLDEPPSRCRCRHAVGDCCRRTTAG
jgi:hypothetical protein